MRFAAFSGIILALASLVGCGGSSPLAPPATPPSLANIGGNWQMEVQDVPAPGSPTISFLLLGSLSVQGTSVSGTFRILPALLPTLSAPCVTPLQVVPFTGSVDSSNLLTLSSAQFSGSVATLQLQLPVVNNIARGTSQMVGGACATPSISLIGVYVPSVTGTYAGTLTPVQLGSVPTTNTAGPATITLTQSPANPDGQFPVTATLTFNSTSCALTATLFTGTVSGLTLQLTGPSAPGVFSFPAATFSAGTFSVSTSPYLHGTLNITGSTTTCPNGLYRGDLMRQ